MTNSQSKIMDMETTEEIIPETFDIFSVQDVSEVSESISVLSRECVICYESLNPIKNMCITECGHEFCFSCMMKHVQRNNGCPCCRTVIMEELVGSDSEFDENYDSDDDENVDNDSDVETLSDDEDDEYPIETFVSAFVAKGYGLKDALSMLMDKFSKTDEKYTKEHIEQMWDDIENMDAELQREHDERTEMANEDKQ